MNTTTAIGAAIVTATAIAGAALIYTGVPNSNNSNMQLFGNTGQLKADKACDDSLWKKVYHGRFKTAQDRLTVLNPCITVTGTLIASKDEPDGDKHCKLHLDAQFQNLLNAKNLSDQGGNLVVEPVCVSPPSQRDAVAEGVCNGYRSPLVIPPIGTRVSVTGPWVRDNEHQWNEIHGPTDISVVSVVK